MANKMSNKSRSLDKTATVEVSSNPFKATEWYKPKSENMSSHIFAISYTLFLLAMEELSENLLQDESLFA